MTDRLTRSLGLIVIALGMSLATWAADEGDELPLISGFTASFESFDGFVPLWFDHSSGKTYAEINRQNYELLYVTSLPAGVGSNDLGLDRGQLKDTRVVRFERSGRRMIMIEPNLDYRAVSDNSMEQRAVADAFARSVLAGFDIVAAGPDQDAHLIDISALILTDSHQISQRLKQTSQGSYKTDRDRSLPLPQNYRGFPDNSVLEAWITFAGSEPGSHIRSVTPTAESLTVRTRHNFIRLPEDGFEMRPFHPRSGFFSMDYRDYATPLNQPVEKKFLVRHRLRDPSGALKPLIYYLDPGAPEPIRSALLEGAAWWSDAFAAAGYDGLFQVRMLPEDIDPLDIRYNVIQWVHRSTRGWSYGFSVVDPRTGEIIKGHISLGSLRVRQDMLIAESLVPLFAEDGTINPQLSETMALARLRQLSAHEIGHTLGLAHNFAASSRDDASVMDYPHPNFSLDNNGNIDLSRAYDSGIGEWDVLAIRYGYEEFDTDEATRAGLAAIIDEADEKGLSFISDPDARGFRSVHADAHLWDNGSDPIERLQEILSIRNKALARFSLDNLAQNAPISTLESRLVPLYLLHRYQAEATAKLIAGLSYRYALKGDGNTALSTVPADRQHRALDTVLSLLDTEHLELDDQLLSTLLPPAYEYRRDREYFTHLTGRGFDSHSPARTVAQLVSSLLLEPGRVNRLIQQHAKDAAQPGYETIVDGLTARYFGKRSASVIDQEIAWVILNEMMRLYQNPATGALARSKTLELLTDLRKQLGRRDGWQQAMSREISEFLEHPMNHRVPPAVVIPPGSPI